MDLAGFGVELSGFCEWLSYLNVLEGLRTSSGSVASSCYNMKTELLLSLGWVVVLERQNIPLCSSSSPSPLSGSCRLKKKSQFSTEEGHRAWPGGGLR